MMAMSAEPSSRLLDADEFYRLPAPAHGGKMELLSGEVVIAMPVGGEHSVVALNLAVELRAFVIAFRLGQVGVERGFRLRRNPDMVRAPDVHFLDAESVSRDEHPRSYFDGPPSLAVEVVSPEDRDSEVHEKIREYLEAGTPRVWVVRPASRTVTVLRPDGSAITRGPGSILTSVDAGFAIDGLHLAVDGIFA